jgi:hypothetical protein
VSSADIVVFITVCTCSWSMRQLALGWLVMGL